jgi:hypothetical protein
MPLTPRRVLRAFRYAMFFDGVDDHVDIPLTVYRWPGITIQEWMYPFHPKANISWSKFSMIGVYGVGYTSTFIGTDNRYDYTFLGFFFTTRTPDETLVHYVYGIYTDRNTWVNVARRFSLSDRALAYHVNGSNVYSWSIPSTEATVLEWNPDTATYPSRYKRFVLGANVLGGESMKMMQYQLLIYARALPDPEILWNYLNPDNPIRNGLILWLQADPNNVKDVDGDGLLEWIDLSGFGNHGKIYGARLVELIKTPARTLTTTRALPVAR